MPTILISKIFTYVKENKTYYLFIIFTQICLDLNYALMFVYYGYLFATLLFIGVFDFNVRTNYQ